MKYVVITILAIMCIGCSHSKLNMKTGKIESNHVKVDPGRQKLTVKLFKHDFSNWRGAHDIDIKEDEVKYKFKYRF